MSSVVSPSASETSAAAQEAVVTSLENDFYYDYWNRRIQDERKEYDYVEMSKEKRFLNEVVYNLDEKRKICVGLSIVYKFSPCVKIVCDNTSVSFLDDHWKEYVTCINQSLMEYFMRNDNDNFNEDDVEEESESCFTRFNEANSNLFRMSEYKDWNIHNKTYTKNIMLINNCFNEEKVLYFEEDILRKILSLQNIINYRLNYLKELDFANYYQNTLISAHDLKLHSNIPDTIEVIIKCCILTSMICPQAYCMLECVNFFADKLNADAFDD